jgi:hypothetical protein
LDAPTVVGIAASHSLANAGRLMIARTTDGGQTWSAAEVIRPAPGFQAPEIVVLASIRFTSPTFDADPRASPFMFAIVERSRCDNPSDRLLFPCQPFCGLAAFVSSFTYHRESMDRRMFTCGSVELRS